MAAANRSTKPNGYSDKQTVRILTVDKDRFRVECATRDGAAIYAAIWESPVAFRWPKTGEVWTVRKDMGIWRIDSLLLNPVEAHTSGEIPLDNIPEGSTRLLGEVVYTQSIDLTQHELRNARIQNLSSPPSSPVRGQIYFNITDDHFYVYNGTSWEQLSNSSEVAEGKDANFVHEQPAAVKEWDIVHGLGKIPSVIAFNTEGQEIDAQTHIVDNNHIILIFNIDIAGKAILN